MGRWAGKVLSSVESSAVKSHVSERLTVSFSFQTATPIFHELGESCQIESGILTHVSFATWRQRYSEAHD